MKVSLHLPFSLFQPAETEKYIKFLMKLFTSECRLKGLLLTHSTRVCQQPNFSSILWEVVKGLWIQLYVDSSLSIFVESLVISLPECGLNIASIGSQVRHMILKIN